MDRNFFRRVEIAFPVRRPKYQQNILRDLETYLRDDTQAWELDRDGGYRRVEGVAGERNNAQGELMAAYTAGRPLEE
ncbi:MAG: RNA degradosome polyphosphate kinase, partial [Gammaproteobacteria bacterium]|nr:RNA degradosome polyphosphate kinase [Gammaproteobacteria bacterium]